MPIFKGNRIQKIATLLLILAILLMLNIFRYTNNASKTYDNSVVKWYKDNWTGIDWIAVYGKEVNRYLVGLKPHGFPAALRPNYDRIVLTARYLTIAWFVIISADIALLMYFINKKE